MSISKLSVNRPVTVLMIFLGIILLGFISWTKLPQELFPSITYPQITVVTSYENAAPEEIESLITKIVEEAVGTVNNVKRITSISKEGMSLVMVEFNWGTNMDFAALNVREKIDLIKEKLPRESQEPIVMKYNPFDLPILNLAVTGPQSPMELRELCRKYIKDGIEKVEGVASATITGGEEREILVEINQPRLRASQISIVSIVENIRAANLNYPAGTVKESFYEYLIRTMGEYQKISEIQETPTALDIPEEDAKNEKEKEEKEKEGRRLVFLKDISIVKDTAKEKTSISRYNGKDSVSLVVRKQSGTNTINVIKGIKKEIEKLLAEKLPKGVIIQITYDQSTFIQEAIGSLRDAGIQGGVLSLIVLLLFLWEIKSSLIITSAIPICVTATATAMYFANLNLNMMSLGGLAMGVGMVIDNANVVIENIFRYRQLGKSFKDSLIDGTAEMISPIIGSTLTNIAVFLPFAFVIGIAGQIFKQLSFTISFSLIASILVAVSLVPVLMLILGESKGSKKILEKVEITTDIYREKFKVILVKCMDQKHLVVISILGLFVLSVIILLFLPRQFMPKVDQRQFIIKIDLPPGSKLEITDSVVKKFEKTLLVLPEVKDVTVNMGSSEEKTSADSAATIQTLGSHQAQILVNLKRKTSRFLRERSTDDVIQLIKNKLEKEPLEKAEIEYVAQETSLGSAVEQGAPIAVEIKGPDINKLTQYSSMIQERLKTTAGVYGIKSSMAPASPETKLTIMKDKASLYGLSVRDIAITAQVAIKGYVATKFKEKAGQEDVDIRVRLRKEDRANFGNLRRLLIHSPLGIDIPISEVAYFTRGSGPTEIKRIDQQRSIIVTANIFKRNFNDVANDVEAILSYFRKKTSADYTIELAGEQQRMKESFGSLAFALALAILLVYMIMAAEFESLWQPFLIMFTVPLSLIGTAFSLFITGTPLSVVAYLGIIMLGGIAVNNGIVLIEFVNSLRKEGYSAYDAVIEASKTRLRPILMTSLTTILGLLPLALGFGEGSELQAPLALTVMGGLTTSTFLTLIFIPALYVIIVDRFEKVSFIPALQEEEPVVQRPAAKPTELEEYLTKQIIEPSPIPPSIAPVEKESPIQEREAEPIGEEKQEQVFHEDIARPEALPAIGELNSRQKELLGKLKTLKKITRKGYSELFGVSVPTAARDLKELVDKNLLVAKGPLGPGRWYELIN